MKRIFVVGFMALFGLMLEAQTADSIAADTASDASVQTKVPAVVAADVEQSDSAYMRGDYKEAIRGYESLLSVEGESAELFYNLGNSYYKDKNIAKAILNYERALRWKPGDKDIRFNLELARSKAIDKVVPVHSLFSVSWLLSLVDCSWAVVAVVFFFLFLATLLLYMYGKKLWLRKTAFAVAFFSLVCVVFANLLAYWQKETFEDRTAAILMAPSVTVKSTPNENGTDLFILHEGRKVRIKDGSMKEWAEIQLEDGNVGWIPKSVMEVI